MFVPTEPKIYHIVHADRLHSIVKNGYLWCDAAMAQRRDHTGTTIGMTSIKERRLKQLTLTSHPTLINGVGLSHLPMLARGILPTIVTWRNWTN